MEYKRFQDTVIVRIDRDEEITEQMKTVAEREKIQLASVATMGAIKEFTVGVFNTTEKQYYSNHFEGTFEIVSLNGTISTKDGEYYQHLHMSAGNEKGEVFGGHLNAAIVSATCEMVINVIDGVVDRSFDEEIGLNLFRFS